MLVPAPADAAASSRTTSGRGGGNLADQAACTVPDPFDTPVLQFFSGVMIVDSAGKWREDEMQCRNMVFSALEDCGCSVAALQEFLKCASAATIRECCLVSLVNAV